MIYTIYQGIVYSRAGVLIDTLVLLLIPIVLLQAFSIFAVTRLKYYQLHKRLQTCVVISIAIFVLALEYQFRVLGWQDAARLSPYYDSWVFPALILHIALATSFLLALMGTFCTAINSFSTPPKPSIISPSHRLQGRITALLMMLTILSALGFYLLAFVA